jgi:hypothetical protein
MEGKGLAALIGEKPVDPEVKAVLRIMNELLGKLPDDVIEKFSQSADFELYHMVLERYGVE